LLNLLHLVAWLVCVVYCTIPSFWFLIHPFAEYWRSRRRSPYLVLLPAWIAMWVVVAAVSAPWRRIVLYANPWAWLPAVCLFAIGIWCYVKAGEHLTAQQLGGVPEVLGSYPRQRLVTGGIRNRVRHPVYLGHLCEMLGWSIGTGLAVCYCLTAFAMLTGAVMIRMEDAELERRFGEEYRQYKARVPAVVPKISF
jgi:protein-S-isoprenylcysteine O-methyltransferase Ste14